MSFADLPRPDRRTWTPPPEGAVPRMAATMMSKSFRATRALDGVQLRLAPGEIHGLVGQNGCGKSTLMKILSGYHAPDPGAQLALDGETVALPLRVADLSRHNIAVVHQSLGLVPEFSVLENMRVGRLGASRLTRRIRWSHERQQAAATFERLGQTVDLDRPVAALSAEQRATVGIARALQGFDPGHGVLLLDEATRALTRQSLRHFYEILETVTAGGAAVLMVSHRLEEVLEVCDRVTVLRDGHMVASAVPSAELDEAALTRLMLGYEQRAATRRRARAADEVVARVEGLSGAIADGIDLTVESGEIVGITGLAGGGFEEIPYLLAGAAPAASGTLTVLGERFELAAAGSSLIGRLIDAGVVLVPEKRDEEGLALELSMEENLTLPRIGRRGNPWATGTGWQQQETGEMIERLGIRPPRPDALLSTFSGGNQQKVMLGKWLVGRPQLLLLHEPTQAVDVGARRDIIDALAAEAQHGCAIIVSATDVGDLELMCDRVLIVRDGVIAQELTGDFDQDQIVEATFRPAPVAG